MILVFVLTILSILVAIGNQKEDTKIVATFFNFFNNNLFVYDL